MPVGLPLLFRYMGIAFVIFSILTCSKQFFGEPLLVSRIQFLKYEEIEIIKDRINLIFAKYQISSVFWRYYIQGRLIPLNKLAATPIYNSILYTGSSR